MTIEPTLLLPGHVDLALLRRIHAGGDITLALDREWIPNFLVAAINLTYQPEWSRLSFGGTEREATIGIAGAMMAQLRPGFYLGGEARYLRT